MASDTKPIRVLHVDDDPAFSELVATFLERESGRIDVETVDNATDGLERLLGGEHDCVVSDYEMPGTDGIEFLRQVRAELLTIPFILFTGKGSEAVASEAVAADVSGYLRKGGTETFELLRNRIESEVDDRRITASYREYETVIESLSDPVYVLDEEGQFTDVNDAFVELVGYDEAEIVGSDVSLLKSPEGIERSERHLSRLLSEDTPDDAMFEVEIRTAGGESVPCEDHMGVIPYDGDEFRGSVGVLRDISDRRRGTEFRRRLYEIVASPECSFEETCRRVLELGCERLGTAEGKLVRVDEAADRHETVVAARDTDQEGSIADLSRTFCRRVVETDDPVAFHDAEATGWDDDPAHEAYGHACYAGSEVTVDGERYGTVCFFGPEPRATSFSDAELTFVDLIARATGRLIERERAERNARRRKEALERIHAIVSDRERSHEDRILGLLDLGRETFGTEYAMVSDIAGETYEIEFVLPTDAEFDPGDVLPLSETGCERVMATEETKAAAKLGEAPEFAEHPIHTEYGVECYIGSLLYRDGDSGRTLCFTDRSSRDRPFTEWERAFVEQLSQWVRYVLDERNALRRAIEGGG